MPSPHLAFFPLYAIRHPGNSCRIRFNAGGGDLGQLKVEIRQGLDLDQAGDGFVGDQRMITHLTEIA